MARRDLDLRGMYPTTPTKFVVLSKEEPDFVAFASSSPRLLENSAPLSCRCKEEYYSQNGVGILPTSHVYRFNLLHFLRTSGIHIITLGAIYPWYASYKL